MARIWLGSRSPRSLMLIHTVVLLFVILPSAVLLPLYFAGVLSVGSLQVALWLLLLYFTVSVHLVGFTQCRRAFDSYHSERRAAVEARERELERRQWEESSERQARADAERTERERVAAEKNLSRMRLLWISKGFYVRGRLFCRCICLRRSVLWGVGAATTVVLPLLVALPLATTGANLGFTMTKGASSGLLWVATLALPLAYVCVLLKRLGSRLLRWRKRKRGDKSALPSDGDGSGRQNYADGDPDGDVGSGRRVSRFYAADSPSRALAVLLERIVPLWLRWQILICWAVLFLPVALGVSLRVHLDDVGWEEPTVPGDHVQDALWVIGLALPAAFGTAVGLYLATSTGSAVPPTQNEQVRRELANLRITKRNGWPPEYAGEYPYWSSGYGLARTGIREVPVMPDGRAFLHSVNFQRVFYILVVGPLLLGLPAFFIVEFLVLQNSSFGVRDSTVLAILIAVPCVSLMYFLAVMLWGVITNSARRAAPWFVAWQLCGVLAPLIGGIALLAWPPYDSDESITKPLGSLLLVCAVIGICIGTVATQRCRHELMAWYHTLLIEKKHVEKSAWIGFCVGSPLIGLPVGIFLLSVSLAVSTESRANRETMKVYSIALSLLSFLAAFGGVVWNTSAVYLGFILPHHGLYGLVPFIFVGSAIFLTMYASTLGTFFNDDLGLQAGELSFVLLPRVFSHAALALSLVQVFCLCMMGAKLRRARDLKRKYGGYFPEDWELANPTSRFVVGAAAGVAALPTSFIRAELERRNFLKTADVVIHKHLCNEFAGYADGDNYDGGYGSDNDIPESSGMTQRRREMIEHYLEDAIALEIRMEEEAFFTYRKAYERHKHDLLSVESSSLEKIFGFPDSAEDDAGNGDAKLFSFPVRKEGVVDGTKLIKATDFSGRLQSLGASRGRHFLPTHTIEINLEKHLIRFTNMVFSTTSEVRIEDIISLSWSETNQRALTFVYNTNRLKLAKLRKRRMYTFEDHSARGRFCLKFWEMAKTMQLEYKAAVAESAAKGKKLKLRPLREFDFGETSIARKDVL